MPSCEGRHPLFCNQKAVCSFNSCPRKRADCTVFTCGFPQLVVSIHALARGQTDGIYIGRGIKAFQFMPSQEGRLNGTEKWAQYTGFNSCPRKRADYRLWRAACRQGSFNSCPRKRADIKTITPKSHGTSFNSCPRKRADLSFLFNEPITIRFQFMPSQEGRLSQHFTPFQAHRFQFMPSQEGRLNNIF